MRITVQLGATIQVIAALCVLPMSPVMKNVSPEAVYRTAVLVRQRRVTSAGFWHETFSSLVYPA